MATRDFTKNYEDQSDEYKSKFSQDEFRGQKAGNAKSLAQSASKKRYTDHFNKIATSEEDAKNLIADYEKNTQGLDADRAFEALEGGRQFDLKGGDKMRYDKAMQGKANDFKDGYVKGIKQNQDFSREFGDNRNTIGDNARIYGNVNQGNQDFSVNIGSQSASGGSRSGGVDDSRDTSLDNVKTAAMYTALNENQYERSRAKLTGTGQAAKYSAQAEDLIGTKDRVKGLDDQTDGLSTYYRELAQKQNVMAFGDYMSPYYKAPKFKAPAAPAKIEVNYKPSDD